MKQVPDAIKTAMRKLNEHHYQAYLVGGAVRDLLLNQTVKDYDITTDADPDTIRELFAEYTIYDIGQKHGTVCVLIKGEKIDITPFRSEADYEDHRHPSSVSFDASLKEDLQRRDFTINAMCLDADLNLTDYFNGLDDLHKQIIRCINDPYTRFNEDGLRILRAIRFMSQLDFTIEEKTAQEVRRSKDLLIHISAERKKEELLKILSFPKGFYAVSEYHEVFDTFIDLNYPDRPDNPFSEGLYALAYLSCGRNNDFHALKYSKEECRLLKILQDATQIDINDDLELIKALSTICHDDTLRYLSELHGIDLKDRYDYLSPYILTLNELAINGDQIRQFGYQGKEIGAVKNDLLNKIHHKQLPNETAALLKHLQENKL